MTENPARIMSEIAPRLRIEFNISNGNLERVVRKHLKEHGCPSGGKRYD